MAESIVAEEYHARVARLADNLIIDAFPARTAANVAAILELLVTHREVCDGTRLVLKSARDAALHLSATVRGMERRRSREAAPSADDRVIWAGPANG